MSEAEQQAELVEAADALDLEPGELQAILNDVADALEALADVRIDMDDPADLERARRMLPTEEHRARILAAALPRPLRETLEYVPENARQGAYWRRGKEKRDPSALSDAELKSLLAFAHTSRDLAGTTGTVETSDGRRIERRVAELGDRLRGRSFSSEETPESDREKGLAILDRIRRWV